MSATLADLLDLQLAWRRVRYDLKHRAFLTLPYEVELVETDRDGWLGSIDQLIRTDTYNPHPMVVCDVPKSGWLIRPGSHLALVDRVVYTAAIGACFPQIHAALAWSQGTVDFAYRLATDPADAAWLRSQFTGWQDFREESKTLLGEASITHAVFADIAGFYENIDIAMLISDLRSINADGEAINLLSSCLNRWAQSNGRGIPQGISGSDILAKLYLNAVDLNLRALDFRHLRYVDDMRIFAESEVTAKRAVLEVIRLLRRRGLNVQSAKTEIFAKDEALRDLGLVVEKLNTVAVQLVQRMHEVFGSDPYMTIPEIDDLVAKNPEDAPLDVVEEAYTTLFQDPETDEFNATMFHFLLGRLAQGNNELPLALNYTEFLRTHPEETEAILGYAEKTGTPHKIEGRLLAFLTSPHAIYSYQNYQIMNWIGRVLKNPTQETIAHARKWAFDPSQPGYLKAASRRVIAEHGVAADLERLEAQYPDLGSATEQAELICSLRRMEQSRRNTFLNRAAGDGDPQSRAVRWVRAQG